MNIPGPLADRIDFNKFPVSAVTTLSIAAFLWLILLEGWLPMPMASVDAPMNAPGVPELLGTTNGIFGVGAYLLMWGTMMMAMMLPSLVPAVRQFRDELCGSRYQRTVPVAAFVGTYAFAWTLTGIIPLSVDYLASIRTSVVDGGSLSVGILLLFAGIYQLSPLKRRLLGHCRHSLEVSHRPRIVDGIRHGLGHAGRCIGCTWALFALMVGLGSMNLPVMIGLTLAISLERLAPAGDEYALALGIILLAAGVLTATFGFPTVAGLA